MPKQKRNPRLQVAFEREQFDLIQRLAELQGTSMAKIVKSFFEQVEPMLRDVVVALEAAKQAQGRPAAELLAAMARLQSAAGEMTEKAVSQGDMFAGQIARAAKRVRKRAQKGVGAKRGRAKR